MVPGQPFRPQFLQGNDEGVDFAAEHILLRAKYGRHPLQSEPAAAGNHHHIDIAVPVLPAAGK